MRFLPSFVHSSGNCPFGESFVRGIVCPGIVRSGSCLVGEMSGRGNVRLGNCPVGELSGQGIVRSGNGPSGNCRLGNCPGFIKLNMSNN